MKKLLFIAGSLFALGGCKEIGPSINFGNAVSIDTTYVLDSSVTSDPHNVLVEEFTGQNCENCPEAHADLVNMSNSNVGRINIMGMYMASDFPQVIPPSGSTHDLRDSLALSIASSIYGGVNQLPSAGIDRTPAAGALLQVGTGSWDGAINNQLKVTDSLNLYIQANYNATSAIATATVTVIYTQPVPYSQSVNIAIVEDSIKDVQAYPALIPPYPSGFDTAYWFGDVFRGMITSGYTGDVIKTPTVNKETGRYYRRVYTFSLPPVLTIDFANNPPIVASHCRLVAFITNSGGNGSVAQSAQTPLVGQ